MNTKAIIQEIETIYDCKWQVAKTIFRLSQKPPGTFQQVNHRPMSQEEAARYVTLAIQRIQAADEDEAPL